MRDEDVKDRDHIIDVIKRFQDQSLSNLAEVSVYKNKEGQNKFRMILIDKNQLEILANWLKQKKHNNFKRIHLDATGKITMKIFESELLHHVMIIGMPKADGQDVCNLVPVGEMVSDDSTGENIGYFAGFVLSRVTEACLNHLIQIGTDDSWANVHAIFSINTLKGKNMNLEKNFNLLSKHLKVENFLLTWLE